MRMLFFLLVLLVPAAALAAPAGGGGPELLGVPLEFALFGVTLVGVALFHHYTLQVALSGLAAIVAYKLAFTSFDLGAHVVHEWEILVNLLGLLLGFAILAKHFEDSRIPEKLPHVLPDDWKGGLALLALVFVMSAFLDNIAAAMIGGTIARHVFRNRVHIGFLAAIVAAANAGGAGSVVGDTTTTMMWIAGVSAFEVIEATLGAVGAWLFFGYFAARQQHAYQPIQKDVQSHEPIDWPRVGIVAMILVGAVSTNVLLDFPAVGVWIAIVLGAAVRKPAWSELPTALRGSVFLLALVLSASMMPVEKLPPPSAWTTLGLGFISSVFDNIPLTKLAIDQDGYDWGLLAYAVGYGGSMVWFGSSAGVALSGLFPEARSVGRWVRGGWHIPIAYVIGFFVLYGLLGWEPLMRNGDPVPSSIQVEAPAQP